MSDDPDIGAEDGPDAALAAEYVLRLLGPEAAAACAARVNSEPAFADLVAHWRADLSALDADFRAVAPPPALARRIEARLFGDEAAPARPSVVARLWNSVGLWRGLAVAALVAAAVLAAPLLRPPAPAERLVSALAPANSDVSLIAALEPDSDTLSLTRTGGAARPGRALELWLIPGPGAAPVSLGVLPAEARARVEVPRALAASLRPGALLAVSDEAPGGSVTGAPGTVLAAGPLTAL